MVVVELGEVDPDEREQYLDFLAENDIRFVRAGEGETVTYEAEISLLDPDDAEESASGADLGSSEGAVGERSSATAAGTRQGRAAWPRSPGVRSSRPGQETKRMLHALGAHQDHPDFSCYTKFCSLIESRDDLEPRERSLKWTLGLISDIYEERARMLPALVADRHHGDNDASAFAESGGRDLVEQALEEDGKAARRDPDTLRNFPVFVMDYLSKRYGLRRIVDQVSWDLVFNVHAHRRNKLQIEVFARFLEEYYDRYDLVFFLRIKAVVDDTVQRSVQAQWARDFANAKKRATVASKSDVQVFLKWSQVVAVARVLFGGAAATGAARHDFDDFLELVDEHCISVDSDGRASVRDAAQQSQVVETTQLLHLAVALVHDTRAQRNQTLPDLAFDLAREDALREVLRTAQRAYRDKLRELGFAEAAVRRGNFASQGMAHEAQVEEMCSAIKTSLLRHESTRDSMADINESTIREWADQLLTRERLNGADQARPAEHLHNATAPQPIRASPSSIDGSSPSGRFDRHRARASDSAKVSPMHSIAVASPPASPPPPPPLSPPPDLDPIQGTLRTTSSPASVAGLSPSPKSAEVSTAIRASDQPRRAASTSPVSTTPPLTTQGPGVPVEAAGLSGTRERQTTSPSGQAARPGSPGSAHVAASRNSTAAASGANSLSPPTPLMYRREVPNADWVPQVSPEIPPSYSRNPTFPSRGAPQHRNGAENPRSSAGSDRWGHSRHPENGRNGRGGAPGSGSLRTASPSWMSTAAQSASPGSAEAYTAPLPKHKPLGPTYAERLEALRKQKGLPPPRQEAHSRDVFASSRITAHPYPPPSPNSGSSTELILREIQSCLARCKERYVEALMATTPPLPPSVLLEIEKEVRTQLDRKSRTILNDVIGGPDGRSPNSSYMYETGAVPNSYSKLESEFKGILRTYNETDGSFYDMSRKADEFCHSIINTSELRQEIEPLVALLVTYASARLGGRDD